MKKLISALALLLALTVTANAQVIGTSSITAASSDCATTGSCAAFSIGTAPGVTFNISGTFSATLIFEASSDGVAWVSIQATNVATNSSGTAGASGTYAIPNLGFLQVRVRASAYVSGTVLVSATRGGTGSGGSGSGGGNAAASATGAAVPASGDYMSFNSGGNLTGVSTGSRLPVTCDNCGGGTGGTAATDGGTFTASTSTGTPGMGAFDDASPGTIAEDKLGIFRITTNRALHINLRTAAGVETGIAAAPLQVSLANTGANATAVKVDNSAVTQPVSGTFWQATQPVSGTVTANIGTVATLAVAAKQPALGTAGSASTDVITIQGIASGTVVPISVASLPLPSTASTSTKQSDGSQKTQVVDGSGNVVGSTSNALDVNIKSGGGSGGTASTFGSAFPSTGTAIGAKDSGGTNMAALNLDASGNLLVAVTGAGSGGTSSTDGATYTASTTAGTPAMSAFDDVAPTACAEGKVCIGRMSARREAYSQIRDAAGNERGANVNASNEMLVAVSTIPTHAVTQSGTWTVQPGNTANSTAWLVAGGKTHNNATPGATNLGVLGFLANAAAPTFTETDLVLGSVDLHGSQRMLVMDSAGNVVTPLTAATTNTTTQTTGEQVFYNGSAAAPTAVGADGRSIAGWADTIGRVHITGDASMTKLLVTPDSVALPANQSVNTSQVNGVTVLMNNGAAGTGSQRVTQSNDATSLATFGVGATGSAPPANANYLAGITSGATGGLLSGGVPVCDSTGWLDMTTATTTEIAPLVASRTIHVCTIIAQAGGTTTFTLKRGTGTNCGTGTTAVSPGWELTAQTGFSQGSGFGELLGAAGAGTAGGAMTSGNALCVTSSAGVNLHVLVRYAVY